MIRVYTVFTISYTSTVLPIAMSSSLLVCLPLTPDSTLPDFRPPLWVTEIAADPIHLPSSPW